ncbi:hypothetical protein EJB05_12107 [Eragrostis curvula]|uniref:Uncharacterized protein n=1 Tax=Eragrostis curvula TaxID=38414 RepID=A0A5J9VQQ1_9POAL|nr:hypothetical protein EJB05_12107 [Eragrostis curvula]
MAKPATAIPLTMVLVALVVVTLHLQAQAVMEGDASVQELSRPKQATTMVMNGANLVCQRCHCCIAWGDDPETCYTSCCYKGSQMQTCGCAACGGN